MWNPDSRPMVPKQVDGIAGQADPVHPMLQAVLIQAHNRLVLFTGKGLNPSASLKPIIYLDSKDRLGPVHRHPKGFIQHRRVIGAHRLSFAEHLGSSPPSLTPLANFEVGLRFFGSDGGPGYRKTGDDGMRDPTCCADTAQDL